MKRAPGLILSVATAASFACALAVTILVTTVQGQTNQAELASQKRVSVHAARALQLSASTVLEREWNSLSGFARHIDLSSTDNMREFSAAVLRASDAVTWAGVADMSGTIIAGAHGVREGEDVRERLWFVDGLQGGRIGSVFVPKTLSVDGASGGLINMSRPVYDAFGTPRGVAVYTLRIDWLLGFMSRSADRLDVDFEVFNDRGDRIMADLNTLETGFDSSSSVLAQNGIAATRLVELEGGDALVVSTVPNFVQGDMPQLGWTVSVRVPAYGTAHTFVETAIHLVWVLIALVTAIGAFAFAYAIHFLLPLNHLVQSARAMARGELSYPIDTKSSREAVELSDALLRLQETANRNRLKTSLTRSGAQESPRPANVVMDRSGYA